jgi:hypothetical protein
MRIIRLSNGASCEFRVYPVRDRPGDPVAPLVRHLRRKRLPFLIGATVGDHALLLTIGPLTAAQAAEFAQEWAGYLE